MNLRKTSEEMEGFFLTTHISDLLTKESKEGLYLYVCIRYLNDENVNRKINYAGIPLLVQVSHNSLAPMAETVILVSPKSHGVFYYEPVQFFNLQTSPLVLNNREYEILDVHFNEQGRIMQMDFKEKHIPLHTLERDSPFIIPNFQEEINDEGNNEGTDIALKDKDFLKVKHFAQVPSANCQHWPTLKYQLPAESFARGGGTDPENLHSSERETSSPPSPGTPTQSLSPPSLSLIQLPESPPSPRNNSPARPVAVEAPPPPSNSHSSSDRYPLPSGVVPPALIDEEDPYIPIVKVKGRENLSAGGRDGEVPEDEGEFSSSSMLSFLGFDLWPW